MEPITPMRTIKYCGQPQNCRIYYIITPKLKTVFAYAYATPRMNIFVLKFWE